MTMVKPDNVREFKLDPKELTPTKLAIPAINSQLRLLEKWRGDDVYRKYMDRYRILIPPTILPVLTKKPAKISAPEEDTSSVMMIGGKFKQRGSKTPETTLKCRHDTKRTKIRHQFDALNRTGVPIPHLNDSRKSESRYEKRSMKSWYTEVVKVPSERPPFAVSLDWEPPSPERDTRQHYLYSNRSMFQKSQRYGIARDFTINPEWESEITSVSIYSPAYRTWPIRYGWCC